MEQKMKIKVKIPILKILTSIILLVATVRCGAQQGTASMVPWMAALMGGSTPASPTSITATDSNGTKLPEVIETPLQEVPTAGPANITGSITATNCISNGSDIDCKNDTGLNITLVKIQLVSALNERIAITYPSSSGAFSFIIPNLKNGNYRVLINTENGLNYTYSDFNYIYDPTNSSGSTIKLSTLIATRYYIEKGPAIISGLVITSGFKDQNGSTIVPQGAVQGVKVSLYSASETLVAEQITDSAGKYIFNIANLPNGMYSIKVFGADKTFENRPFQNVTSETRFIFLGNDPSVTTSIENRSIVIQWIPSPTAPVQISNWKINNAANPGLDLSGFTVQLKKSGTVVSTSSTDATGNFSFQNSLEKGEYEIEISKTGFLNSSISFNFIPNYSGNSTPVVQSTPIFVVPRPSNITGNVAGFNNTPSRIHGATINFKPAKSHPPSSLAYLLKDEKLKNLAELWIRESCTNQVSCNSSCGGANYTTSCAILNQGTGPWTYSTFQNKMYEVLNDNLTVYFTAAAGKWEYYISASGYKSTDISEITLNGQDVAVPQVVLTESILRGTLEGQTIIIDTLTNNTKNSYGGFLSGYTTNSGIPGLFVLLFGNNDNDLNSIAHITMTSANGSYKFDGSSRVVSLPPMNTLCNNQDLVFKTIGINSTLSDISNPTCSSVADSLRISYTIASYSTASLLNNSPKVAGTDLVINSVHISNDNYRFKQGSYSIIVVDPLKHLSPISIRAEISENSISNTGLLNLVSLISHLPRRTISGSLTDVISTANIDGATVTLGIDSNPDPNLITFSPSAYKDLDLLPTSTPRINPTTGERSDILIPPVTTSANGAYSITNVDPGNYLLKFNKEGYDEILLPVTIPSSGTVTIGNAQTLRSGERGSLSGRVVIAGGERFTGSYNLELLHPYSGVRPTAPILPSSLTSGSSNYSNASTYSIFTINSGQWKLKFSSPGYVDVEGLVVVQSGLTTNFDIITMIPGSQAPASITGTIFNSFNNQKITSGLTLTLRPGINTKSGSLALNSSNQSIQPITYSGDGSYAIPNVPAGNYTLEASGTNFATTFQTVISAGNNSSNQNLYVSPLLINDEVRVVLTWNKTPSDLDSHLEYGDSACRDGVKRCQVVWNDQIKLGGHLTLDVDVVDGFGPETVTLKNSVWSKPRRGYSVYNWSNESSIASSGATIKVFKSIGLVKTYNAGSENTGRWWQAFCFDSSSNIIDIGKLGCEINSFFNAAQN